MRSCVATCEAVPGRRLDDVGCCDSADTPSRPTHMYIMPDSRPLFLEISSDIMPWRAGDMRDV